MSYDLTELYTILGFELDEIQKIDKNKLTYSESGEYIIPRIFVNVASPMKFMDELDNKTFGLNDSSYLFKKCAEPLSEIIQKYYTGSTNYFGNFLEEIKLKNTILMISADCSKISGEQNAMFGVNMVGNCPEMKFQKVSKEQDIYTLFVFTKEDYRVYLRDLMERHSTVRQEYPLNIEDIH